MENITEITTIEDDGIALLLHQFAEHGNANEFVRPFLAEVQVLESAIVPAIALSYLNNADTWMLDQIGKIVGVARGVLTNAQYRIFIYAKIASNVSYGTLTDVYNVMRALGLGDVKVKNVYPASITVNYIPNNLVLTCMCIRAILEAATQPIEIDITAHSGTPFGFMGDTSAYGFGVGELGQAG